MFSKIFFTAIVLTSLTSQAEMNTFKIESAKEIQFAGERLKANLESGKSANGYGFHVDGDYVVFEKEEIEMFLKYKGLTSVSSLVGTSFSNSMENGRNGLLYEVLNARKKGQYKAPTQDEMTALIADGLLNNDDSCPVLKTQIDPETSFKHAQNIFSSTENKNAFEAKLRKEISRQNKSNSLAALDCPQDLAVRGPATCYEFRSNGKLMTTFILGPYSFAGISCKAPAKIQKSGGSKGSTTESNNRQ